MVAVMGDVDDGLTHVGCGTGGGDPSGGGPTVCDEKTSMWEVVIEQ